MPVIQKANTYWYIVGSRVEKSTGFGLGFQHFLRSYGSKKVRVSGFG